MIAHMAVVAIGKFNKTSPLKSDFSNGVKSANFTKKVFLSFLIALIIESVLLFVIGSSLFAVYIGFTSDKSNLHIAQHILLTLNK